MQSRRTIAKMGLSGLVALGSSRMLTVLAQTPETITMDDMELSYQGMLATSQLPELPKAPDGECAIVLQGVDTHSSAVAVIHNASDEIKYLNAVSGTGLNEDGGQDASVPEESLNMPRTLNPGDYGLAYLTFPEFWQAYTDVTFELEFVAESELDPSRIIMPVTRIQLVNPRKYNSLNAFTQNRSEHVLGEGSGFVGVFLTPEGEIADWFNSMVKTEIAPGERYDISHSSTGIDLRDSFMVGFSGLVLE